MNRVILTGTVSRAPEVRTLANGKDVCELTVSTNDYLEGGRMVNEHHRVVVWDRLATIVGMYVRKDALICVEGRLQTREWDDDAGRRHWRVEVIAASVELLRGSRGGAVPSYARSAIGSVTAEERSEP